MEGPARPAPGRLLSRPAAAAPTAPPDAGVRALDAVALPDALLLVPHRLTADALLVHFHGAGGHAARSLPAVREAAAAYGVPVLLPSSAGPTWDLLTGGMGADVAALDAALAHVLPLLPVGRVALSGFSDGASYALSLGLANGDLVEAVLAFSPGFAAPPVQVGRPRVWLSHGTADAVLPVDRCGRRVARLLRDAAYDVEYVEFAGGHVMTPDLVDSALAWWLRPPA